MKSIYIAGGKANNTAINIMKYHLEQAGHRVTRDAKDLDGWDVTLRWGVSYHGDKPALNAQVNEFDKYVAFERFGIRGVPCPRIVSLHDASNTCGHDLYLEKVPNLPWLARKRHHVKGKDIVVCENLLDVRNVLEAKEHDFFSVFIPTQTEYRVWVIRDQAIATYEKTFKGKGEYEGFMRNRRFGFKFEKRDNLRGLRKLEEPCVKAVAALNMDFGGVDVILGKDGKFYVLEVNTMMHIDSVKRSSGIRLAAHISRWAEEQ